MRSLTKSLLGTRISISHQCVQFLTNYRHLSLSMMANQSSSIETQLGRIAVTQMTSVSDKEKNMSVCEDLVKKATAAGAKMVFLPEACDYLAETKDDSIRMAESIQGPLVARYRELAASFGVWLSLGGLHIKEEGETKLSNTHVVINGKGEIVSTYKKTHLFSVHIPEKNLHLEESSFCNRGDVIHPPVLTPVGKVALAICYDMRFPELSLIQRKMGAQILTFPSAFTVTTGLAHWESILRGRAIETQCYVIAAAQTGQHNKKRSSYGHALVVDPWGKVLSDIEEGTDFALVDIDLGYVEKIRRDMPVICHRRSDIYNLYEMDSQGSLRMSAFHPMPSPYVTYQFGKVTVPGSCIFLKSSLSQAFVNKKPVVPGHILVTSERPAKRLIDLTIAEICDLLQLTQTATEVIIKEYEPESVQIALQDGPAAGQTIEHVHFHVVPMSSALREKLQGHERTVKWRDMKEMEEEATKLRHMVISNSSSLFNKAPVLFKPFKISPPTANTKKADDQVHIPEKFLIAETEHSYAFVAPHPILSGHVCVTLKQLGISIREVSADALTDLFLLVQLLQKNVEDIQKTSSSTLFILQALQSDSTQPKNLQVHVIPRTEGDFPDNDDIYSAVGNNIHDLCQWMDSHCSESLVKDLRASLHKD